MRAIFLSYEKILIHLPAYREPELIPTIKSALDNAKHPKRLVFGICRQFKESDGFDNVDEYRNDSRFKIIDIPYNEAKGLPYARALINDELLADEDYILQLDSHHRFDQDWDDYLIKLHNKLLKKSKKVIIGGYLPFYDPFDDPAARVQESWQTQVECFYPHGTCFVRQLLIQIQNNLLMVDMYLATLLFQLMIGVKLLDMTQILFLAARSST